MSNKKKNKKSAVNEKAEKYLSYGTLIGLVIGLIIGTTVFLLTDNMFWMALAPIVLLFAGLGIGSYLGKSKKAIKKHS
ncbi:MULTISPECIES: hypothetical protein [unclassified Clostridium]|uniref:hypothetical protein n=1 Tax=Clostridium TaxID=1485 RepID=UPI001C8CC739|nr:MULTISPECIES: hypothetical protein [unclassified Clostridium]MBX9139331.1 hypothetical protein [Clostridium sp. K12(2020)]MBX9146075.1 hypothetical protein [Clostridium sp. K13]MDU2289178.1 hypothetical protein [Clostridium celatum]